MKSLYKANADRAIDQFQALLSNFGEEKDLADRVRAYLAICKRQRQGASSPSPRTYEDLALQGVFHHNEGDYPRAIKYLSKALEMDPKSDHAHYCLAAAYARSGDTRNAVRHLRHAILASDYNRVLAMSDEDFDSLRSEAEFEELLGQGALASTS